MKYHLQVIGATSLDARVSVAVVFDSQRYLFNCGEGTQRFLHDRSKSCSAVSGAKTRQMFFTRTAWQCIGGLPGMVLTLSDAGAKGITMRGPPGFTHSLAAMRSFLFRPTLPIQVKEYSSEKESSTAEDYKDENLTVKAVRLTPNTRESTVSFENNSSDEEPLNNNGKRSRKSPTKKMESTREAQIKDELAILGQMFSNKEGPPVGPTKASKKAKGNEKETNSQEKESGGTGHPLSTIPPGKKRANDTSSDTVISYICKGPISLGKFNIAAAKALGIPMGPMYANLKNGKSVTLADGRVIQPSECVSPSKPGPVFIIMDCPSVEYIPSILASTELNAISHNAEPVQCIIHLLGDDVLEHPDYKTWMNSFGEDCQHIVSSVKHNVQEITLRSTAKIQHDLNYAENAVFPLPYCNNEAEVPLSSIPDLPKSTTPARPLLMYQFEPTRLLDSSAVLPPFVRIRDGSKEIFEKFKIQADAVRGSLSFGDPFRPLEVNDMICVPLGTGASIPGKYRNVSSTYLRFSDGGILLDAGEGTLAQLYRHYGPRVDEELVQLRCLFVSHLHADHHLGAISILKRAHELKAKYTNPERICVVGPARYLTWLTEYADVEDFGLDNLMLMDSKDLTRSSKNERFKQITKTSQFQTLLVKHCADSYALVLTHASSGIKVAFSGDCRPSPQFVQAGKDSDLVIHEATLADEMKKEAVEKNHCTTNEAIQIGKSMNAKNLLLTHFSQRYPKLPVVDMKKHVSEDGGLAIGVAFDSMRIRLKEFKQLETLYGPLTTLWSEVVEEQEQAEAAGEEQMMGDGFVEL
ncbi:beta-lactamase-like protein [Obelidium mucronatum]|nr:beta-lactamase-like protein [Obelidium mucronatum]